MKATISGTVIRRMNVPYIDTTTNYFNYVDDNLAFSLFAFLVAWLWTHYASYLYQWARDRETYSVSDPSTT